MSHDGGGYGGGHHGGFGGHHHSGFGGHHHHHGANGSGDPGVPFVSVSGGKRSDVRGVVIFVVILAALAVGLLIAHSG